MIYANKFDLSPADALHGLYYMAVMSSEKVINISYEEVLDFLKANAERNRANGIHPGMVNSCFGYFIGVNVIHAEPDVTEYDEYYGYGTAEKAFEFERAMKKIRG